MRTAAPGKKRRMVGIALLVGLVLFLLVRSNAPSLLDRAMRVPAPRAELYLWGAGREVLCVTQHKQATAQGYETATLRAEAFSPRTGAYDPLNTLNTRLKPLTEPDLRSLCRSPDGRWLLLLAHDHQGEYYDETRWQALEVDGQRRYVWSLDDGYGDESVSAMPPVWLPDSRRWLTLERLPGKPRFQLYSLDTDAARPQTLDAPSGVEGLLGVTRDYRLIATDFPPYSGQAARQVQVFEIGLYPNPPSVRTFTLHAPPGGVIQEITLSPQADRLAWKCYFFRKSPGAALLARFLPSLSARLRPQEAIELWVSRTDGTAMRRLGAQGIRRPSKSIPEPVMLQWTPDGKRIGFVCQDAFYTIAVE